MTSHKARIGRGSWSRCPPLLQRASFLWLRDPQTSETAEPWACQQETQSCMKGTQQMQSLTRTGHLRIRYTIRYTVKPFKEDLRLVLGIHVDQSSLSTNHELASQTSSSNANAAGVCPEEYCGPAVQTLAFDDEVCEANSWLVERELRSTCKTLPITRCCV